MAKKNKEKIEEVIKKPAKRIAPNRAVNDDPSFYPQNAKEHQGETFEVDGQIYQKPTPVVPEGNDVAGVK